MESLAADDGEHLKDAEFSRTSDLDNIKEMFVVFYKDLYKKKNIDGKTLEKVLKSIDLALEPKQAEALVENIHVDEMADLLAGLPSGKAPGPDAIPYGVWSMDCVTTAITMTGLFNNCKLMSKVMKSAKEATIILLPKEKDSYTTAMYRPISLTNTDYKILMRVWANRLAHP